MTRALLEQALEVLEKVAGAMPFPVAVSTIKALKVELAKPAQQESEPDAMSDVADRYAHKLALDLECVLADYSGKWYDEAINTIGEYRSAMNAIHERESPTFMGEPMLTKTKAQQERKPMTISEIGNLIGPRGTFDEGLRITRAVEAFHSIKETL